MVGENGSGKVGELPGPGPVRSGGGRREERTGSRRVQGRCTVPRSKRNRTVRMKSKIRKEYLIRENDGLVRTTGKDL